MVGPFALVVVAPVVPPLPGQVWQGCSPVALRPHGGCRVCVYPGGQPAVVRACLSLPTWGFGRGRVRGRCGCASFWFFFSHSSQRGDEAGGVRPHPPVVLSLFHSGGGQARAGTGRVIPPLAHRPAGRLRCYCGACPGEPNGVVVPRSALGFAMPLPRCLVRRTGPRRGRPFPSRRGGRPPPAGARCNTPVGGTGSVPPCAPHHNETPPASFSQQPSNSPK